jgi:hypothetical protein
LKFTSSGTHYLDWTGGGKNTKPDFYKRFYGRTVTLGCWVKTDGTASAASLKVKEDTYQDPSGGASASTATTDLQWLEATHTFGTAGTDIIPFSILVATGETVYVSCVILSFGSSIGEGNYVAPVGEIVWLEKEVKTEDYENVSISANGVLDIESQTSGKLPKGAKSVFLWVYGTCGTTGKYFAASIGSLGVNTKGIYMVSQTTTVPNSATGWSPCDSNGDIYIERDGTFTTAFIRFQAVQVS